jgi:hypothetical protein
MMIIEQMGIGFSIVVFAFSIFGWGYLLGRRVEHIGSAAGIRSVLRKSHTQARRP